MKKLIVILYILSANCFGQSFTPSINPVNQVIQPGQNTSFNVTYTPTGGYNASIFLQATVPGCLIPNVSLSANSINFPYPTTTINVTNTTNVPLGIYDIILKSYNGGLIKYDTCQLTVNSLSTPSWFKYDKTNFPLYDQTVEKSLCIKNKIWFFTMCCSYGNPGGRAIMSFDGKNWEGWYNSTDHFKTDVCGDTILKNTVPSLSSAFNLKDMTKYGTDVYYITMNEIIKIDTNVVFSSIPAPSDLDHGSNSLLYIRFDNFGKIWLKSWSYIYYQDATNNWQKLSLTGAPFTINDITDFTFDTNNQIWFSTSNAGVSCYNGTFWQNYKATNSNLPVNAFSFISKDLSGNIYVCSTSAIYKYNGSTTWLSTTFNAGTPNSTGYGALAFDNFNMAHIGLSNMYYKQTSTGFTSYNSSTSPLFTPNAFPVSIDFDLNNNVVFGDANGGIVKYGVWNFATSIIEVSNKNRVDFSLYPNPTAQSVTLHLPENQNYKIEVFDCLSKSVFYTETNHMSTINIDVKNIPSGIYFVKVSDETAHTSVKKLIKQ